MTGNRTAKLDPVAEMMAALLPVHSALTQDWLVDAACTAAERLLDAPFAFVLLEDQEGKLEYRRPASDLRRRSHQRALDALGSVVFRIKLDPREAPALAEALDNGAEVSTGLDDFFGALTTAARLAEAERELSVDTATAAPLQIAGERLGALVALTAGEPEAARTRALAEHIACAAVNLRNVQAAKEHEVVDVARSVFDARKLESELQRELTRAVRYKREVSICVIEATNLRLLRERFGRFLADRLLQRLGESLAQRARDIDLIGAYKETGYTMVLTEAGAGGAETAAQRLLAAAQAVAVDPTENVPGLELHLACGYATCPVDGTTTDALFAAAQRRMYGDATQVA